MIFKEIIQSLGVMPDQVAVVTLATDGFRPEQANILMLAMRRWDLASGVIEPALTRHVLIEGGDCGETQHITGITPDIYMTEAVTKTEAETFFLQALEEWGTTCLAGHSALKYMMPFMTRFSKMTENLQCMDTQLMSKIYHHRRWVMNDKIKSVTQFMTENSKLSFPRDPCVSLEALCEHFEIPAWSGVCPYSPLFKALETDELLRRLWEVSI